MRMCLQECLYVRNSIQSHLAVLFVHGQVEHVHDLGVKLRVLEKGFSCFQRGAGNHLLGQTRAPHHTQEDLICGVVVQMSANVDTDIRNQQQGLNCQLCAQTLNLRVVSKGELR